MSVNSSTKASARQHIGLPMHYAIVSKKGHKKMIVSLDFCSEKHIVEERIHFVLRKSNLDKLSGVHGAERHCKQVNSFFWGTTF